MTAETHEALHEAIRVHLESEFPEETVALTHRRIYEAGTVQ